MSMTARTMEYPNIQGHLLSMSTGAARLARIGRIDSNVLSPSFFRFGVQLTEEGRPRGICNAFGKTMVVSHTVNVQILNGNDAERVHDLTAFLVRKILPPEGDALMHTGYSLAMLAARWFPFGKPGMLALHFGQGLLFLAEKVRVVDLFPSRERSERLESDVYPYLLATLWQAFWLAFNREGRIPFARRRAMDGTCLDLATDGTMIDHLDAANLGEAHTVIVCDAEARLREGETVIASIALESRESWVLSMFFAASEEGFHRQIDPNCYVLQHLGMHRIQRSAFLFQYRKSGLLPVERQALASVLIGFFAFFQHVIIEPTALFKGLIELCRLLLRGKNPILKHFTHVSIKARTVVLSSMELLRGAAFIPMPKGRGLSPRMSKQE
jgi:hypothetical protein